MATDSGWKVFDAAAPVLTYTYSFGPGTANALAAGVEGGIVLVSPPCRVPAQAFDGLEHYGPVRALIASNAFHHMGIPEWKSRFPNASVFAPAQSLARVERHTKLSGIRPLAAASSITGLRVELVDMPHYRTGEVLVRVPTPRGLVWYVTDFMMNLTVLPSNPFIKLMFKMTGSAPGLRFNNVAPFFMVRDKAALKAWLGAEFDKNPPAWIIPAHGDIFHVQANREAARRLFAQ